MKTQWLYYFSLLAEYLDLDRTAYSLDMNAATLKKNIQQLEAYFGTRFFSAQYTSLTAAGLVFKERALAMLVFFASDPSSFSGVSKSVRDPSLWVGWSDFWGYVFLPHGVQNSASQRIHLQSYNNNWEVLYQALNQQVLDVVLTTYSVHEQRILPEHLLKHYHYWVGASVNFRIYGRAEQSPEKHWSQYRYIQSSNTLSSPSPTPFWNEKLHPRKIQMISPYWHLTKLLCQRTDLVAFLPELFCQKEVMLGQLKRLSSPPQSCVVKACLLWKKEGEHQPSIQALVQSLKGVMSC